MDEVVNIAKNVPIFWIDYQKIFSGKQISRKNVWKLPLGMAAFGSRRSPLILAPANIPITDGKNTENISFSSAFHLGQIFAMMTNSTTKKKSVKNLNGYF